MMNDNSYDARLRIKDQSIKLFSSVQTYTKADVNTVASLVMSSVTYRELNNASSGLYSRQHKDILALFKFEQAGNISEWEKLSGLKYSK